MDIVEEIINDEKDAKRLYYFRKFLAPIVILTIVVAIAIAGYSYYKNRKEEHIKKTGDLFAGVITENIADGNMVESTLKDIIENSDIRVSELAKIKLIHDNIFSNNIEDAKKLLHDIVDGNTDLEITKAYAHILLISLIIDQDVLTDSDQLQVSNLLHYFSDENKIFYANSQLLKALFHFRLKQYDVAEKEADKIIMKSNIPTVVRDQADALKVMIKYQKQSNN